MADDSGAFKTNPANLREIWAFCDALQAGLTGLKRRFGLPGRAQIPPICNNRRQDDAVSCLQPDSRRRSGSFCVHRVPFGIQSPCRHAGRVEHAFMLPGFRFLVAAIVLSMSILVFGLGAAALLRAAHEEFASRPSWRGAPETVFAQPNEVTQPTLAMLRLEPAAQKIPEPTAALDVPAEPTAAPAAEPERIAALKPESSRPAETTTPETPALENPIRSEVAPAQEVAPAPADETKIAVTEPVPSPANEAAPDGSKQASTPVAQNSAIASTKIATLGGPPVSIEPQPSAKKLDAEPDRSAIKKRQQARRAAHRRKIALRARTAQQAPQQPAADAFSQPTITVRNR
jgi:hypothetical protein